MINNLQMYTSDEKKSEYERINSIDFRKKDELVVVEVPRGRILSEGCTEKYDNWQDKPTFGNGGVFDESGRLIPESEMLVDKLAPGGICKKRFGGTVDLSRKQFEYCEKKVMYMGFFWRQWGHFLIDIIGRLWFALGNDYPIVYMSDSEIQGDFLSLIEMLGIDADRLIRVSRPTIFETVYVPETSFFPGRYYSEPYRNMIDRCVAAANQKCKNIESYEKIYFSKQASSKPFIGERTIEMLLSHNGFKVMYPEKLSLFQEIYYVANCKVFASTEGSISHNAVFAKDEIRQYVFCRSKYIIPFLIQIAQTNDLKLTIIDSYWKRNDRKENYNTFGFDEDCLMGISDNVKHFCLDNELAFSRYPFCEALCFFHWGLSCLKHKVSKFLKK